MRGFAHPTPLVWAKGMVDLFQMTVKASAFFAQPFERSLPKFAAQSQPSIRDLGAKF